MNGVPTGIFVTQPLFLLPIPYCLLPIPYCLFPIPYCLFPQFSQLPIPL